MNRLIIIVLSMIVLNIFGGWIVNDILAQKEKIEMNQLQAYHDKVVLLRARLQHDLEKLAGEIGVRNVTEYKNLNAAADFIETYGYFSLSLLSFT